VVLAKHRDIQDPDAGAGYTVKLYGSEKEHFDDGTWRHRQITLKPSFTELSCEPIELEDLAPGELVIVAELVEVLG
jgi:hypothetical protein